MSDGFDERLRYGDDCPVCDRPVKSVVVSRANNGPRVYNGECSEHTSEGRNRYIFHQPETDELRFTAQEYGTLCDWLMVSDPWELEQSRRDRMVRMLNQEATRRGYDDWIQAYHDNHMEDDPRKGHEL